MCGRHPPTDRERVAELEAALREAIGIDRAEALLPAIEKARTA